MRLESIQALTPEQRARVEAIYLDAFPPAERAAFDTLLTERFLVPVANGQALGLAVLRDLGTHPWAFLRYFAVGERGRGVGGDFWRLLVDFHRDHDLLLLDVEDPDEAGLTDAERELRWRRIGFYERLGVHLPEVRGYAPPHDGVPLALRPMITPLRAGVEEHLTGDGLREVLLAIFEHRYGYPADSEPVVATLRASGLG